MEKSAILFSRVVLVARRVVGAKYCCLCNWLPCWQSNILKLLNTSVLVSVCMSVHTIIEKLLLIDVTWYRNIMCYSDPLKVNRFWWESLTLRVIFILFQHFGGIRKGIAGRTPCHVNNQGCTSFCICKRSNMPWMMPDMSLLLITGRTSYLYQLTSYRWWSWLSLLYLQFKVNYIYPENCNLIAEYRFLHITYSCSPEDRAEIVQESRPRIDDWSILELMFCGLQTATKYIW